MAAIRYPIASNAESALHAPLGRAERETDAAALLGAPVRFVTEPVGPAFATREAALATFANRVETVGPEDRYCTLREVLEGKPPRAAAKPTYVEGRRWPTPPAPPRTVWRLSISYWRPLSAEAPPPGQARTMRRDPEAAALPAQALKALAARPLEAVRPQKALDIGLFEVRLPEAPHIVVPDE